MVGFSFGFRGNIVDTKMMMETRMVVVRMYAHVHLLFCCF